MSKMAFLVGFYEECPTDHRPFFLQVVTVDPPMAVGNCPRCERWFKAVYEWIDGSRMPKGWGSVARHAMEALADLQRKLVEEIVLVELEPYDPPQQAD